MLITECGASNGELVEEHVTGRHGKESGDSLTGISVFSIGRALIHERLPFDLPVGIDPLDGLVDALLERHSRLPPELRARLGGIEQILGVLPETLIDNSR
jgi:hypothetical protein